MERWMGERERERCILYNNSFFRRLLLPREKKKRERREREGREEKEEKRREKKRKTGERKASGPDENREALFACFGVVIRRERDRTRLTSQQRLFFSFFFSRLFVCFFHFCFVFSFLPQERRKRRHRRRKPIPSTLRRQEQHRYIILEHSSRVLNHHHQHERYLSVPSSKYYKKVSPFRKAKNPKTP